MYLNKIITCSSALSSSASSVCLLPFLRSESAYLAINSGDLLEFVPVAAFLLTTSLQAFLKINKISKNIFKIMFIN